MAFTNAKDNDMFKILGENGCPQLNTSKDSLVDLFFKLNRDLTQEYFLKLLNNCLTTSNVSKTKMTTDLFVLCFQTRNCRGGKGERKLFRMLFLELYLRYPKTSVSMLPLILHYGYGKDFELLYKDCLSNRSENPKLDHLSESIIIFCAKTLKADNLVIKSSENGDTRELSTRISLLAKWLPANTKKNHFALSIARNLFPDDKYASKSYRKMRSYLNKYLGTTQILMCSNQWESIVPEKVPSVCLHKEIKAFINEDLNSCPLWKHENTGNRFPHDPKRVQCRQNFRESLLKKANLKSKGLFPHQIVSKLLCKKTSSLENEILKIQWDKIRETQMIEMEKESYLSGGTKNSINFGNLIPLSDVSASMSGTPMEVSIALGIMVSELTAPALRNRVLTFTSVPTWVRLEEGASISDKVKTLKSADWGASTNFELALDHILDICVENKFVPKQIPDLIVFSDMQFDETRRLEDSYYENDQYSTNWETQYEKMVNKFSQAGIKVSGQPWPVPTIIFWNLRGDTEGIPVESEQPGVKLMSGFSPSLLKYVLLGEELQENAEIEEGENKTRKDNPQETLQKILNDSQYDLVREFLSKSTENGLREYYFEKTNEPEVSSDVDQNQELVNIEPSQQSNFGLFIRIFVNISMFFKKWLGL